MSSSTDKRLGAWGEALTANWLYTHGYTVLAHHVCYREGELDLIAQTGETLAVVEVKLRTGDFMTGSEAVTSRKQERIRRALGRYLSEHPALDDLYIRFDVCQITAPKGIETPEPEVEYMENAFY